MKDRKRNDAMNPRNVLSAMMHAGAVLSIRGLHFALVHAEFVGRTRLFFIGLPALDQSSAHTIEFVTAKTFHDRDVALCDAAGEFIAYLAPAIETPEVEGEEVIADLVAFRASLKDPMNAEPWERFVAREKRAGSGGTRKSRA